MKNQYSLNIQTLNGSRVTLNLGTAEISIENVISKIEQICGIPADQFKVMSNGKELKQISQIKHNQNCFLFRQRR